MVSTKTDEYPHLLKSSTYNVLPRLVRVPERIDVESIFRELSGSASPFHKHLPKLICGFRAPGELERHADDSNRLHGVCECNCQRNSSIYNVDTAVALERSFDDLFYVMISNLIVSRLSQHQIIIWSRPYPAPPTILLFVIAAYVVHT